MPVINQGFHAKRPTDGPHKLPPGQYETPDFPVLTAGPTPRIPLVNWEFRLEGLVEKSAKWSWNEFNALPQQDFNPDIHCVTKWSKFDTKWRGVSFDTLLEHVQPKPEAQFVMAFSYGGYFAWPVDGVAAPLLLVAGGSGVVPLMAMLRHRQRAGLANPVVLLFSVRSPDEFIYQHELEALAQTDPTFTLLLTYTRRVPVGWVGYRRRLDAAMLAEARGYLPGPPQCYVCGPTGLVETVATLLQAQGLPDNAIRTERFGPTGS